MIYFTANNGVTDVRIPADLVKTARESGIELVKHDDGKASDSFVWRVVAGEFGIDLGSVSKQGKLSDHNPAAVKFRSLPKSEQEAIRVRADAAYASKSVVVPLAERKKTELAALLAVIASE